MDSRRLAERILYYADERTRISEDGKTALAFSTIYTPERYRNNVRELFTTILNKKLIS